MGDASVAIQSVIKEAVSRAATGEDGLVLVMKVGHDSKVLKKAIDDIKRAVPNTAFLCISISSNNNSNNDGNDSGIDEEANKLSCFAVSPSENHPIKADKWLSATVSVLGN